MVLSSERTATVWTEMNSGSILYVAKEVEEVLRLLR